MDLFIYLFAALFSVLWAAGHPKLYALWVLAYLTPASKSNLIKEGDFILEVDGVSVKTKTAEEIAALIKKSAEDKVEITFERNGEQYKETLIAGFITIKSYKYLSN